MYFATRYFSIVGLPIVPLGRFYLRETEKLFSMQGAVSRETTRYAIAGRSRIRVGEVLRTYLFCWLLGPAIVLVPIGLLLGNADEISQSIGFWWVFGGFIFWLFASIFLLVFLMGAYRKRWAPLREALRR